jgi:hypothetical protein
VTVSFKAPPALCDLLAMSSMTRGSPYRTRAREAIRGHQGFILSPLIKLAGAVVRIHFMLVYDPLVRTGIDRRAEGFRATSGGDR